MINLRGEMDTELAKFTELLAQFKLLQPYEANEQSLFSIGCRGYYENPTTDILAFFCNVNGPHQLGNAVLQALFDCIRDETRGLDCWLISSPEREVVTKNLKRIDLLLEGPDWVMVLENKIYHQQNNPFAEYQSYVDVEKKNLIEKKSLFVLLAPTKEQLPSGWVFISYLDFINALKIRLTNIFISQPINKWALFLREFILHLESLMQKPSVNQQAIAFILKNLSELRDLEKLKLNAIDEYHRYLRTLVEAQLDQSVDIRSKSWDGFPALRFTLPTLQAADSDIVLFLSGDATKTIFHIYANLRNGLNEQQADEIVMKDLNPKKGFESGKKFRTYYYETNVMNELQIVQFISERLLELDNVEKLCAGSSS